MMHLPALPQLIFWTLLLLICYTYVGYPALLWLLARLRPRPVQKIAPDIWPRVSLIIAGRNEATRLPARIENILTLDYPPEQLELVIIADGCQDTTEQYLLDESKRLTNTPFTLKHASLHPGRGKPAALNLGVSLASGDIIVFADCRQHFSQNTIRELVACFSDPQVGAVSGELVFQAEEAPGVRAEMGLYWRYEVMIRRLESGSGSVVGATGAIYAMRRELYRTLPEETLLDDVLAPLEVVRQGYRVIFDGTALAWDTPSRDIHHEWQRKVRTLAGNWQLLSLRPTLFLPWKNSLWWRLWSHKIFRLLVPWWLFALLPSGFLVPGIFPQLITWGLVFLLLLVGLIAKFPALRYGSLLRFLYFFAILNAAALWGGWLWMRGDCLVAWKK